MDGQEPGSRSGKDRQAFSAQATCSPLLSQSQLRAPEPSDSMTRQRRDRVGYNWAMMRGESFIMSWSSDEVTWRVKAV